MRRDAADRIEWRLTLLIMWVAAGGVAMGGGFRSTKLGELDAAVASAIAEGGLPGAVVWLERGGESYHRAYGSRALVPTEEAMTEDTIFDAASLTKVLATTPSVMRLIEEGKVELDAPVKRYLAEFQGEGRDEVTLRHLLTHTSGLRPGIPLTPAWAGYDAGIELACAEKPTVPPGTVFRYSDVNFLLLGEVVRRVSGEPLDVYARRVFYEPLGMRDTGFRPASNLVARIAPTEKLTNGVVLRGVVHDPTARRMGGVAGHAGLFTTASDAARFSRMLLAGGELEGVRVFRPETVKRMSSVQTPEGVADRRGLGWDIDSPYAGSRGTHMPLGSYGHTGWTGTSMWVDPFSGLVVILMSNRNHPTEDGSVGILRRQLATLAAEAVADFNYVGVPGALAPRAPADPEPSAGQTRPRPHGGEVRNGVDVLKAQAFAPLQGLRVGLITNHTGTDRERHSTIDLLASAAGVQLKALFSPEHGIRGEADEKVLDGRDPRTGLPVYSLYGETRKPRPEQLAGLDALVFDIQDIGCRFYTYVSTMGLAMEAAASAGLRFIVLDRVNPINGVTMEGPVHSGESTFVAFHAVPIRHGMTAGELARLFQAERKLDLQLTVVPVEGWQRSAWFDETGLPWINPSPNMRNLPEATVYPGVGLLEAAVSVGRGTDTPFEVVGAPYVDDVRFAAALNEAGLAGVRFVPIRFTPRASTFKDEPCGGVSLVVADRAALASLDVGMLLASTLQRMYPGQFALDKMAPLLQSEATLAGIRSGRSVPEIRSLWAAELKAFAARREKFLLYR